MSKDILSTTVACDTRPRKGWPTLPWAVIGGLVVTFWFWNPSHASHLAVMFGLYLLLSYSLNLVQGFGGLILFCHAVFYGIGAYAYALVRLNCGLSAGQAEELVWSSNWGPISGLGAGIVAGSLSALIIGWVCLRFRGDHFIFASLGFQMIVFTVLYNWVELTRGPFGIHGIPRPGLFGWQIRRPWEYVVFVGLVLIVVLPLLFRLYRSPFGLALKAMREDERATQSMAVNTFGLALRAFVVAGGCAGLAGSLYAGYVTYIDPTSFSLRESIFLITILMLGGGGNVRGPLAGSALMLLLPEALRFLGLPNPVAASLREVIYGLLLAALMYWRPNGLAGEMANGR